MLLPCGGQFDVADEARGVRMVPGDQAWARCWVPLEQQSGWWFHSLKQAQTCSGQLQVSFVPEVAKVR